MVVILTYEIDPDRIRLVCRAICKYTSGDFNNLKYITQTIGTYPGMLNIPIYDHAYLEIIVYNPALYVMQRFTTLGLLQITGKVFVRCLVWNQY